MLLSAAVFDHTYLCVVLRWNDQYGILAFAQWVLALRSTRGHDLTVVVELSPGHRGSVERAATAVDAAFASASMSRFEV